MKTAQLNSFLITAFSLVVGMGVAANGNPRCLAKERLWTDKVLLSSGICVAQPLKLETTSAIYPQMTLSERTVQIWKGDVVRDAKVQTSGLERVTDFCATNPAGYSTPQIISVKPITKVKTVRVVRKEISNPNLDPEIRESFRLSPMGDSYAAAAQQALVRRCQTITDQQIKDRLGIY